MLLELLLSIQIKTVRVCVPTHPCDVYVTECERGSRDCFPKERVGYIEVQDV